MFERFSDRSRAVLAHAEEEAALLGHSFIGTEHVLLGLLREGNGVAWGVLASQGVSLEPAREAVRRLVGRTELSLRGSRPFTPRAKKLLELSLREALQLGDTEIASAHVLLGFLREGEGTGSRVLAELGADPARLRAETLRALAEHPREPEPRAAEPAAAWVGPSARGWSSYAPLVAERGWRGRLARSTGVLGPGLAGVAWPLTALGTRALLWSLALKGGTKRSWAVSVSIGLPLAVTEVAWALPGRGRPRVLARHLPRSTRGQLQARLLPAVCSFCSRPTDEGGHVVAAPGVFICGDCVGEAAGVLDAGPTGAPAAHLGVVDPRRPGVVCSFCAKPARRAQPMAGTDGGAGGARICRECLGLCQRIITEDSA